MQHFDLRRDLHVYHFVEYLLLFQDVQDKAPHTLVVCGLFCEIAILCS